MKAAGDLASGQGGDCPFSKRLHPAEFAVNRIWLRTLPVAVI